MTISKGALWRIVAAVAAVAIGLWMWIDHEKSRETTDLYTLTTQVKTSMQQTLDDDPNYKEYNLTVQDLTLVKAAENTYNGIATVKPAKRSAGQVSVKVTYDGTNMMWESPPGSLMFLMQDAG